MNTSYRCGLRPGDRVRLKKDLPIRDERNRVTKIYPAGEVCTVLEDGCSNHPGDVWLEHADGSPHTWSDDESVFEFLEKVDR